MRSFNITGAKVTTVDSTLTTILTYNIPNNTGICARLMVSARNTATNRTANCILVFGAQNLAGVAATVGTPQDGTTGLLNLASGSDSLVNVTVHAPAVSGGQILIQVNGIGATNIQWQASMEILGAD